MKTKNSFVMFSFVLIAAFMLAVPAGFATPGLLGVEDPPGDGDCVVWYRGDCCFRIGDNAMTCPGVICDTDADCMPGHKCKDPDPEDEDDGKICVDPAFEPKKNQSGTLAALPIE